jgi:hypothetical protein
MISAIDVHVLAPAERRMLLEMLAGEYAGDDVLRVGDRDGRAKVARKLCDLWMAVWAARDQLTFTEFGRHVATALAERLLATPPAPAC